MEATFAFLCLLSGHENTEGSRGQLLDPSPDLVSSSALTDHANTVHVNHPHPLGHLFLIFLLELRPEFLPDISQG